VPAYPQLLFAKLTCNNLKSGEHPGFIFGGEKLMDQKDMDHVDEAIVESYRQLRTRIGVLAVLFPPILLGVGLFWGIKIQQTMSNYYFALDTAGRVDTYPVRLWFVGILFVVGFFLHKYHGFSENEDRWLSFAGGFAACVAIFPMTTDDGRNQYDFLLSWTGLTQHISLHGIFAVLAFGCIAIVIVFFADSTLSELENQPAKYKMFKTAYFIIALVMVVSIGISVYLNIRFPHGDYILSAEWAGIWSFAAYWFVKNWELSEVAKVMKMRDAPMLRARSGAELADKL
jgi:hypothetical protein